MRNLIEETRERDNNAKVGNNHPFEVVKVRLEDDKIIKQITIHRNSTEVWDSYISIVTKIKATDRYTFESSSRWYSYPDNAKFERAIKRIEKQLNKQTQES